jgi:hypothetical protein
VLSAIARTARTRSKVRSNTLLEVAMLLGSCHLGSQQQRHIGAAGDLDGAVSALLRCHPT